VRHFAEASQKSLLSLSLLEGKNLTVAHPRPPACRRKSELDAPARDSNKLSSHHPRIPSRPILESKGESPARLTWPPWRWMVLRGTACRQTHSGHGVGRRALPQGGLSRPRRCVLVLHMSV
jgi:hypothetical protein